MIGIILVTHGNFGESLLSAASMIMGDKESCHALGVDVSRPMDEIIEELKKKVRELDRGDGVLILTDMFGGTPTNISLSLLSHGQTEVITGVNLPMLLKALGGRTRKLQDLAQEIKGAGKQGILVAGDVLKRQIPGTAKKAG
ncbi:PTS sugar transporter subunit IIA [Desulfonatronovibrio hydrogenovorans]|uniref:PTS sugar transporter subunit IIA n=1 Tax=Desulfonatronovibrio hydrogenovorans TaxID=53245 RepID=UPI00048D2C8C|nr:PTS sugar transporter subunit IIA [Desulfonatronovibrio hydrogenovorans]